MARMGDGPNDRPRRKCIGRKADGTPCKNYAIKGATVCKSHGGNAPQVRAKAAVRYEVLRWGLGDVDIDPGETLLKLVSQSAARAERYATELEQLVEESPSLREALVAEVWTPTEGGGAYQSGEYVRGLARIEAEERDRCAGFATKAIAAGLAKRSVELAEQQGRLVADLMRKVLGDPELGLTPEQRKAVPNVARRHLDAVTG